MRLEQIGYFFLSLALTLIPLFSPGLRQRSGALAFGVFMFGLTGMVFPAFEYMHVKHDLWIEKFEDLLRLINFVHLGSLALVAVGLLRLGTGSGWSAPTSTVPIASTVNVAVPRVENCGYSKAFAARDALYDSIEASCREFGLPYVGLKSNFGDGDVWLRFEHVLPTEGDASLRAVLVVAFARHEYHRFEHTLKIDVISGAWRRQADGVLALGDGDIARLHRAIRSNRRLPKLRARRLRVWPFQLWRPKNRLNRLAFDWASFFCGLLVFGGVVGFTVAPMKLFPPIVSLAMIGAAFLIIASLALGRRSSPVYSVTSGKPPLDPRRLGRLDSWQASIDRLGERHAEFKKRLLERLARNNTSDVAIREESIWYRGVDGKAERRQIVCTLRRALAFVHIETYGAELFVAWDAHVNSGHWQEVQVGTGIDKITGNQVVLHSAQVGWHAPNEYDVLDSVFLAEWIHANMTRELKLAMAEHRIDQEVDFTVHRERRADVLNAAPPAEQANQGRTSLFGRFTRQA